MSSERGQHIEANCKIIWGDDDYDLEIDTDDYLNDTCSVKKDCGLSFGPPLTMIPLLPSSEAAWAELDRMLAFRAEHVKHGLPMSKGTKSDAFSGREHEHKDLFRGLLEKHGKRQAARKG
jgi:hypothetical protein